MSERHFLVVGGSKGSGLALVEHLLAAGQRVSVLARSASPLPSSTLLNWQQLDVTDGGALRAALDACARSQGKIDSAVFMQRNRATGDAFETDLAVALTATRNAIDHLLAQGHFSLDESGNSIVMVSSIADHYVAPEQDLGYHVSKAGLVQLARYYALQLGAHGIRVNVVSPCVVIKEAAREYYRQNSWITDRFERFIPLRRAGSSRDIINAILFLTGEQSSYITGQNIVVDGGLSLRSHESIIRIFPGSEVAACGNKKRPARTGSGKVSEDQLDSSSTTDIAEINKARSLAGEGARIVFVAGNFNTVHPGHLRLLKFASECGDFLVVGVAGDHVPGALLPAQLRFDGITAISFVDHAFVMTSAPEDIIRALKPSIVVKGDEHESKFNPEQAAVDEYGGKLMFSSGEMRFSSIDLLKRDILEPNLSSIVLPNDYPERHAFTMHDLRSTVEKFKGLRVAVLGDLIVDEYVSCEALGMSQEDPTLVVTPIMQERFIGGAGIVASHACKLGAQVNYFSVAGKDAAADFAREKLSEYHVTATLFEDDSRPTTLKQRFRAAGKTLLRVSHLRQHDIEPRLAQRYAEAVIATLDNCDLVIFSDFNYGCLPQAVVDQLVEACVERGIPFVADSQSSSQMGDVSRFRGAMLLTPTEREARLAVRDYSSGLVVLAEKLRQRSQSENIILTLGAEGILAHAQSEGELDWLTDRLPAFNSSPKDTAGAGDSFLTCTSMAMTVGVDIWQSMYLGSIAAACQVSRVGNIPLSASDLMQELADQH